VPFTTPDGGVAEGAHYASDVALISDIHLDFERSDFKSSASGAVGAKQRVRLVVAAARASESLHVPVNFWLSWLSFKQETIRCSHLLDRRSDNHQVFPAFV
jgi:hypothetical protein